MDGDARHADLVYRPVLGIHRHLFHGIERAAILGAVDHLAKDGIFAVEVGLLAVGNEELPLVQRALSAPGTDSCSAPCSPSRQYRGRETWSVARRKATAYLECRTDLVVKGRAPDRLSALARARCIARLCVSASASRDASPES